MQFPPKAYIIGAQKAGTTTLATLLDQHPSICLSTPKETHFFAINFDKGLEWYRQCFKPAGADVMLLDASTRYTMSKIDANGLASRTVAERIYQARPDARLIYLLRDPVERAFSGYSHSLRTEFEARPFRQAVAENAAYLGISCYATQAQPFIDIFGREAILFLSFRQLSADPIGVAKIALDFLGVPHEDFEFVDDGPKNQAFQYSPLGKWIRDALGSERKMSQLGKLARAIIPKFAHRYVKRLVSGDAEAMSDADRAFLQGHFKAENDRVRELSGIAFD